MKEVSEKYGIPYKLAKNITDDIFAAIKREVRAGNEVRIMNFGKFFANKWDERKAKNFAKGGAEMTIPPRMVPAFVPSEHFKLGEIRHDKKDSV